MTALCKDCGCRQCQCPQVLTNRIDELERERDGLAHQVILLTQEREAWLSAGRASVGAAPAQEPVDDGWAQAHRLALELEALLLSCNDNAAVSKWWDSAHEALEQYRQVSSVEPTTPDAAAQIAELQNKVDRLEWENKGIAEWRYIASERQEHIAKLEAQLADKAAPSQEPDPYGYVHEDEYGNPHFSSAPDVPPGSFPVYRQAPEAAPSQEPEWYHRVGRYEVDQFYNKTEDHPEGCTPLYTHPAPAQEPECFYDESTGQTEPNLHGIEAQKLRTLAKGLKQLKQCKCEHWQTCPTCYPQGFDSDGNRLPPEPTPLEAAKLKIAKLEAKLAAAEKDAARYRWLLDFGSPELWLRCSTMDSYDLVETAIDDAMTTVAGDTAEWEAK